MGQQPWNEVDLNRIFVIRLSVLRKIDHLRLLIDKKSLKQEPKMSKIGKVIQVSGPAVDVQYSDGHLPNIFNAIRITSEGFDAPDPINIV